MASRVRKRPHTAHPEASRHPKKRLSNGPRRGEPELVQEEKKISNVQVILRCRPLNNDETKANTPEIVHAQSNTELAIRAGRRSTTNKLYTFDRVFGPKTTQQNVKYKLISLCLPTFIQDPSSSPLIYNFHNF